MINSLNWVEQSFKPPESPAVGAYEESRARSPHNETRGLSSNRREAVVIMARVLKAGSDPLLLLLKEFRPPVGAVCVGFPAGLMEMGESPEQAALRELKEETGYVGRVVNVSPPVSVDPGVDATMIHLVNIEIDADAGGNKNPIASPEDGECVEPFLVPLTSLRQTLDEYSADPKYVVENKLYTYALAISGL